MGYPRTTWRTWDISGLAGTEPSVGFSPVLVSLNSPLGLPSVGVGSLTPSIREVRGSWQPWLRPVCSSSRTPCRAEPFGIRAGERRFLRRELRLVEALERPERCRRPLLASALSPPLRSGSEQMAPPPLLFPTR